MIHPYLYDVLNVPLGASVYFNITKAVALALLLPIFVISILTEQLKSLKEEKPEYMSIVYTTILITFSLVLYQHIFMKIVALCESIGFAVFSLEDSYKFKAFLEQMKPEPVGIFSINVETLTAGMLTAVAVVAETLFNLFRFALLSLLYIIGPIVLVFGIFSPTRKLLKGWFINVFQISFWVVTLRILQAVSLSTRIMELMSGEVPGDSISVDRIFLSLLYIGLIILTPALTSKLISGQNIGTLASAALAVTTYLGSRSALMASKATGVTAGLLASATRAAKAAGETVSSTLRGATSETPRKPAPSPKKR